MSVCLALMLQAIALSETIERQSMRGTDLSWARNMCLQLPGFVQGPVSKSRLLHPGILLLMVLYGFGVSWH